MKAKLKRYSSSIFLKLAGLTIGFKDLETTLKLVNICRSCSVSRNGRHNERRTTHDGRLRSAAVVFDRDFRFWRYIQSPAANCPNRCASRTLWRTIEPEYLHIRFRPRDTATQATSVSVPSPFYFSPRVADPLSCNRYRS